MKRAWPEQNRRRWELIARKVRQGLTAAEMQELALLQRHADEVLPWDHVNVKKGREYLEKEQERSVVQLQVMADAT